MGPQGWEQMIRQYVPEPVYRRLVAYHERQQAALNND
jgi:hypothetical protein